MAGFWRLELLCAVSRHLVHLNKHYSTVAALRTGVWTHGHDLVGNNGTILWTILPLCRACVYCVSMYRDRENSRTNSFFSDLSLCTLHLKWFLVLKFKYSQKATKIWKNLLIYLTLLSVFKKGWRFFWIFFLAFSKNLNFMVDRGRRGEINHLCWNVYWWRKITPFW